MVERDFCAAVIHSRARLDYPGVAAALGGDTRGKRKKYEPYLPALRAMDSLARQLRALRGSAGRWTSTCRSRSSSSTTTIRAWCATSASRAATPGERQAYSMIEEFMLAANEAVATSFRERGEDTLWRIHDAPDRSRMEEFAVLAENYGLRIDVDDARTPKGLQARARSS